MQNSCTTGIPCYPFIATATPHSVLLSPNLGQPLICSPSLILSFEECYINQWSPTFWTTGWQPLI